MAVRRALAGVLIAAIYAAVPAHADIIAQSAQGFVSRNAVVVAASPAAVWKRLVMPAVWWSSDHTFSGDAANMSLDPVAGGCFCERLPGDPVKGAKPGAQMRGPARGGVEHMRVIYAERGKALRMTGALGPLQSEAVNATLTVTLKEMDGGTRIIFEYVVGGYMRYPPEKIQPAIDTVLSNQLLSLAHGFAPGSPSSGAQGAVQGAGEADTPASSAQGLAKQGLLLPRGRIWSLPVGEGAPAPASPSAAPPEAAAIPVDMVPKGGAKSVAKRAKPLIRKPAAPIVTDDAPLIDVPPPAAPAAAPVPASVATKKRGKAVRKNATEPSTPPKGDEPTNDAVNSAFDSALGDPQHPVTTPN